MTNPTIALRIVNHPAATTIANSSAKTSAIRLGWGSRKPLDVEHPTTVSHRAIPPTKMTSGRQVAADRGRPPTGSRGAAVAGVPSWLVDPRSASRTSVSFS